MAREPDNLVLRMLQEIRAKQDEHQAQLRETNVRLDRFETRADEMRSWVVHALGLGSLNELKSREIQARMEAGEAYCRGMAEQIVAIEQRLSHVEVKVD